MESLGAGRWILVAFASLLPTLFVLIATWFRLGDRDLFAGRTQIADVFSIVITVLISLSWLGVLATVAFPRARLVMLLCLGAVLLFAWLAPSLLQTG